MLLCLNKLATAIRLTFPLALPHDLGLVAEHVVMIDAKADGNLPLCPQQKHRKYTAVELNGLCKLSALMPADLIAWDKLQPLGCESL